MRISESISTSRVARKSALVAVGVLGAAAAVAGWIQMGPVAGLSIAWVSVVVIALVKSLIELAIDVRRISADLETTVLGRIRTVEEKTDDQAGLNSAVLNRVRAVEKKTGDQIAFNDAVLNRVRSVESRLSPIAQAPPGRAKRLARARELLAVAQRAMAETGLLTVTPYDEPGEEQERLVRERESVSRGGPIVTVIVPCFNEVTYVSSVLESVRLQSFHEWECIIVDDGSTDDSVDEIERLAALDDRFHLLKHSANRGVSAARNTGLKAAKGHYVVFHDADDLMMRDSLKDRFHAMVRQEDRDIAGVFCGVRITDEQVSLEDLPGFEQWKPRLPFLDFVSSAGECPFPLTAALLRIEVVRDRGGFTDGQEVAEDWDLWLRIMRDGFYFVPSELRTVIYRQSDTSTVQSHALAHVEESNRLIGKAHSAAALSNNGVMGSYPFPNPLSHYQELLTRVRRAIQYAATTLLRGDIRAFESILATLEGGSWPLVKRHINIEGVATDGFRRASGLDIADLPGIDDELDPLRVGLRAAVWRVTYSATSP